MALLTFERKEIKYIITKEQKDEIIKRLSDYITIDEYASNKGIYEVFNLYFDNDNNDIIRYNNSKPKYKEKFRVRTYSKLINYDSIIYLEIKKKFKGYGNKRRVSMKYRDYLKFINQDFKKKENENFIDYYQRIEKIEYFDKDGKKKYLENQILKEIIYLFYLNDLKPACFISSIRNAYFDSLNNDIRITFDQDIIIRREKVSFDLFDGKRLLDENHIIMEIKISNAMPLYLVNVLSDLKIYSQGFSKYGKVFEREQMIENLNIEEFLY